MTDGSEDMTDAVKQDLEKIEQTPEIAVHMSQQTYNSVKEFQNKEFNTYDGLPVVINNKIPFGSVWRQHEGDL